jgi:hypothetical protein
MTVHRVFLILTFILGSLIPFSAQGQSDKIIYRQLPIQMAIPKPTVRMIRFIPAEHGLAFANTFTNNFIDEFDVSTSGLCGGMIYTALDYYYANKTVPDWPYPPAVHKPLRKVLYDRQVNSLEANVDRWIDLYVNPFGRRNREFFNWGMNLSPGGQLQQLKASIDAGIPTPLGLRSCDENCIQDHQVIAVGYEIASGKTTGMANKSDKVKIFIYDPNHPGRTMTMVPDFATRRFVYLEYPNSAANPRKGWRTYFVDTKYTKKRPPNIGPDRFPNDGKIRGLAVEFRTGNDDLRGGNDNIHVTATFHAQNQPSIQRFRNLNGSKRWISNSREWVRLDLMRPMSAGEVKRLDFFTNFAGGAKGDNWDIKNLQVRGIGKGINQTLFNQPNNSRIRGLTRLTGDNKTLIVWINRSPPASASAHTTPVINEPSTLERNFDRPGAYYKYQPLNTALGFRYCQRLCAKDTRCKSYTYKQGRDGKKSCALKENIYPKRRDTTAVSGIKFKYLNLRNPN